MTEKPQNGPTTGRNPDGTLKKGAKLNPGGRPKENAMFRDRAKAAVDEHVVQAWIAEVVAQGEAWVKCSELLAAYGYGKPASAPEDNEALAQSGRPLANASEEAILAALRAKP